MTDKKITVSEVFKKDLKLVGYLIASGGLGYILATYVAKDPMLIVVFSPAINYVLYRLTKELEGEGYKRALE